MGKDSRKLTPKQKALVKELKNNPTGSVSEATRRAGYRDVNSGYRSLKKPEVQSALGKFIKVLDQEGGTDREVAKALVRGLNATKVISCNVIAQNGEGMKDANSMTKDFVDVPDIPTQVRTSEVILKTKQYIIPPMQQINTMIGEKILVVQYVDPRTGEPTLFSPLRNQPTNPSVNGKIPNT